VKTFSNFSEDVQLPRDSRKAKTLALILEIWAKSKNPLLADEVSKDEK
jgi:hypothetical protein